MDCYDVGPPKRPGAAKGRAPAGGKAPGRGAPGRGAAGRGAPGRRAGPNRRGSRGGSDSFPSYSTAFSYLVLGGAGGYCITNLCKICHCKFASLLSKSMYGIIIGNSALGVITYGFPYGEYLSGLHAITSGIQDFTVFPIYAAILLDLYGFEDEIIYACLFVPVLPTLAYVTGLCDCKSEMEKVIAVAGSIGIGYFSYTVGNQFGIAACVTYLVKCFIVPLFEDNMLKIPSRDLANYTMCGFCYLALRSIID